MVSNKLISQYVVVAATLLLSANLGAQDLPLSDSQPEQSLSAVDIDSFDAMYDSMTADVETYRQIRTDDEASVFLRVAQTTIRPVPDPPVPPSPPGTSSSSGASSNGEQPSRAQTESSRVRAQSSPANSNSTPPRRLTQPNPSQSPERSRRQASRRPVRLARAPNMFGDFWNAPPTLFFETPLIDYSESLVDSYIPGEAQSQLMFGGRRLKVNENGNVLPTHRVYVNYNHFENALRSDFDTPGSSSYDTDRNSVDIWTLGLEKPFGANNNWSAEFRLPLYQSADSGHSFDAPGFSDTVGYSADGGSGVGNLGLILKRLLYRSPTTAVAAGLGLSVPTADDVRTSVRRVQVTFENSTVDVAPWIGVSRATSDGNFFQAMFQVNVPLNGNKIRYSSGIDPNNVANSTPESGSFGNYDLQTLLSVDVAAGRWLFRRPGGRGLTGLAAVAELHATAAANGSDVVKGEAGALADISGSGTTFKMTQAGNRQEIVNMTLGVHSTFGDALSVRFGQVIPLNSNGRTFSTESQVQINLIF